MVFEFTDAWLAGSALQALAGAGVAAVFTLDPGGEGERARFVHRLRVGAESAPAAVKILKEMGLFQHAAQAGA